MRLYQGVFKIIRHQLQRNLFKTAVIALFLLPPLPLRVNAAQVYQDADWSVRWDNTVKASTSYRVENRSGGLIDAAHINADDGDRNFDRGITSARLDLLSELDLQYRNVGMRASAAGWVDAIYLDDNDNDSPATFNGSGANDGFSDEAETLHGKNIELLDAFAFARFNLGAMPTSIRAGRHTLMWGETLFMATNGIANGMAPTDLQKLLSVPSTEAKELFMPVNQLSGQVQIFSNLSLEGFAKFEWRRSRLPASGSYFSDMDMIDAGGEKILLGPNPGLSLWRADDMGAGDATSEFGETDLGSFGTSARFRFPNMDVDWGLYYHKYNDSTPQVYLYPGKNANLAAGKAGEYRLVYPKNIHMIGASLGTQVGPVNVSAEASARIDTPLISTPQTVSSGDQADNDDHPLYALGNTLHTNVSASYLFAAGPSLGGRTLWDGATLLAEAGYTYLLDTTKNESAFDPTRDDYALGLRMTFEPNYYQVFSGFDMTLPIGVGYNPAGKSPVDSKFNVTGADEGGDVSLGLTGIYLNTWRMGISYTSYFGSSDTQTLADRDLISIHVQRTF